MATLTLVQLPYLLHALDVIRERYDVAADSQRITTTHGRSTPEAIVQALTPAGAVVVGCIALARLARVRATAVAALAVGGLLAAEGVEAASRLVELRNLGLTRLVDAVERHRADAILFASTGRTTVSRPPPLLARYVTLELDVRHLREGDCAEVRRFVSAPAEARTGLLTFRGRRARVELMRERLADAGDVVSDPVSAELLLVRSAHPERPRRLIELGYLVRRAWLLPEYGDAGVRRLIKTDGRALDAAARGLPCRAVPPIVPTVYGRPFTGFPGFEQEA